MKKAIKLNRVSSEDQEQGHSIEAQDDRLNKYAEKHDLDPIKTFNIVESSTQGGRKEYREMIDFVKNRTVQ